MPEVTETDVARNLADYLNRVAYRGESFILTRGKRPVAELRPAPIGVPLRELPELIAGLPRLGEADAYDFARELEAARAELGAHDLWIAATCLEHGLAIVTANVREFQRVPDLAVEVRSGSPSQ